MSDSDYSINAKITADDSDFGSTIKSVIAGLDEVTTAFGTMNAEVRSSFASVANQFNAIDAKAKVWGDTTQVVADKQKALRAEINRLIDSGIAPESKQIQDLKKSYDALGTAGVSSSKKIGDAFATMRDVMQGPIAAIRLIKDALVGASKATLGQSMAIEDMTATFTPMVGGIENATKMVAALNKEAATTPYELEGVGKIAKQLLPVFGNDVKGVTEAFRMLGDAAGGNIEKLDSITRGYMKSMLKGKVDMESLNMIAEAGVPIYTELAKSMGVSVKQMMDMSSKGKITSADLTAAFKKMTSEGGIFFNGMNIASRTLSGQLSTLSDGFKQAGAVIGDVFSGTAKSIVGIAGEIVNNFVSWAKENDNLKRTLKVLGEILVSVTAGIIAFAIASNASAAIAGIAAAVKMLTSAFKALNAAMKANWISAIIGLVVAALIPVIEKLIHKTEDVESKINDLRYASESFVQTSQDYKKSLEDLSKNTDDLNENEKALLETRSKLAKLKMQEKLFELSKSYKDVQSSMSALYKEEEKAKRIHEYKVAAFAQEYAINKNGTEILASMAAEVEDSAQKQSAASAKIAEAQLSQKQSIMELAVAYKQGTVDISSLKTTNFELYDAVVRAARGLGDQKDALADVNAETGTLTAAQQALADQISGRIAAQTAYEKALAEAQFKRAQGLIDEKQYQDAATQAAQTYMDALIGLGYASENEVGTKGRKALDAMVKILLEAGKAATVAGDEMSTQEQARLDAMAKYLSATKEARAQRDLGFISETEYNEKIKEAVKEHIYQLKLAGFAYGDLSTEGGRALTELKDVLGKLDGKGAAEKFFDGFKAGMREVAQKMKTVMTAALKGVTEAMKITFAAVKTGVTIFSKLIKLDPQAMLDSLKTILGDITTFFTSTLAKLPSYAIAGADMIVNFLKGMKSNLPQITTTITSVVKSLGEIVSANAPFILQTGFEIIVSIIKGIASAGPSLVKSIITVIKALLATIRDNFGTILQSGVDMILELSRGLAQEMPTIVATIMDIIKTLLGTLLKALPEMITTGTQMVVSLITGIVDAFPSLIQTIVDNLPSIIKASMNAIPMLLDALVNSIGPLTEGITNLIISLVFAIIEYVASPDFVVLLFKIVSGIVKGLAMGFEGALAGIWDAVYGFGKRLIDGIVTGITETIPTIWNNIVGFFQKYLIDPIKDFFGIHSPSTMFADFGMNMIQGLINGILDAGAGIWDAVSGVFSGLWDNISNFFSGAFDFGKNIVSGIVGGVKSAASAVGKTVGGIADTVGSAIGGVVKGAAGVVSDIGSTVGSTVAGATKEVGKFFKKLKFWATGTEYHPGGLALVGEKGPELVNLPTGSSVTNASDTARMQAGSSAQITANFYSPKAMNQVEQMRALRQYNRELAFTGAI